jgi:hypothetical protein
LTKSVPDPSSEHNLAREKHEATTGSWLIEGEELKTWRIGRNSFMWLNGGGKQTSNHVVRKGLIMLFKLERENQFCGTILSSLLLEIVSYLQLVRQ